MCCLYTLQLPHEQQQLLFCLCVWHAQRREHNSEILMPGMEAGTFAFAKTEGKGNTYEGEFCNGVFEGQGENGLRQLPARL